MHTHVTGQCAESGEVDSVGMAGSESWVLQLLDLKGIRLELGVVCS